jgi:hypothetical protein
MPNGHRSTCVGARTVALRGGLKNWDRWDRWKPALHEAILSPTRRLFPDATTAPKSLTGVHGESGLGRARTQRDASVLKNMDSVDW